MLNNIQLWLIDLLFTVPCVLIALTVHEVSHGYMAYKLGDPTARNYGRLTLNPLKHLDPIGTICMIFFHFGWAKPVPINSRYFKHNRRDTALTAAAGPLSNFIMAFIGLLLYSIFFKIFSSTPSTNSFSYYLKYSVLILCSSFHTINLSLGVFNLIPVPPLDGSRIFLVFLPPKYYFGVMQYERYIMFALMLLLYTRVLNAPLAAIVSMISGGMGWIISLIPFL